MSINEAVKRVCTEHLTPGFYAGIKDKTVDKRSSFWRNFIFPQSNDIYHDKEYMFWHEFRKMYPTLMPTDICPCNEGDYIATNDSYEEVMVSQAYWWLGYPVDCDFRQFLKPGENPYAAGSFSSSLEDYMLDLRDKLFMGFDQKEEYWSVMMATEGEITIHPKGGKPYTLSFKRDEDLNLSIEDPACQWCFDPKKDAKSTQARPWDDLLRANEALFQKNRGQTDVIVMTKKTCDWLRNSLNAFLMNCKEGGLPFLQLMLPTQIRAAGLEMPGSFDGAQLAFAVDVGGQMVPIYCVETTFQFCDPTTGQEVCVNPMKDGKVYGFNINATSRNTLGARYGYGRIHNFHSELDVQRRFFHQHITENGKSLKYHGESAPIPLIECPNASWCLDVCGGSAPVEKGEE